MTNTHIPAKRFLLLALLCLPLGGCTTTVGQQFRDIMADIDAQCRKDKMGPYLDENDPASRRKRAVTDCDILKIKPADPQATEEGRFAYSIQLPPPHDKPKVQYSKGMSAESYFKELCEKEAGEWIVRTVEGVEGVFQLRSAPGNLYSMMGMYFSAEAPVGDALAHNNRPQNYLVSPPVRSNRQVYKYIEVPNSSQDKTVTYTRYFRDISKPLETPPFGVGMEIISTSKARFAYIWRGKEYQMAREYGILSGELILFDLEKNEILAFRRDFIQLSFDVHKKFMLPAYCNKKLSGNGFEFITKVIKPIGGN